MAQYLAARCPQCSNWIPLRPCEPDTPTFDPTLLMQVECSHCGQTSKLPSSALEVIPQSQLQS